MALIHADELSLARALSGLAYGNPFLPRRIDHERLALGEAFRPIDSVWHARADMLGLHPNVKRIAEKAKALVEALRSRLVDGARASAAERELYQDACVYVLYHRYRSQLLTMVERPAVGRASLKAPYYTDFKADTEHLLEATGVGMPHAQTPARLFACAFQVCRAFHHTFLSIAGGSGPVARLRSQVWQSIFTHDLRRYQRSLYARMGDVTTLVTGPSGAGKELVARAIGLSRYVPFDEKTLSFEAGVHESFFPLNLSALSPTLVESELFGHRRGAFTGAVVDRDGWLAKCPPTGTVFLDEIGDVDAEIQVKLLRVLETRTFQPLGSVDDRRFYGKIVAATNRELGREMAAGRFRADLYYRLCADTIAAPSLQERIAASEDELPTLLAFLAERLAGPDEAPALAREAEEWIAINLGADYPWPGNVRELIHCISNVMIHRDYQPASFDPGVDSRDSLADEFMSAQLSAEEIAARYTTLVFAETGSYVAAAERLGIDRRTVKARVDPELLAQLRGAR